MNCKTVAFQRPGLSSENLDEGLDVVVVGEGCKSQLSVKSLSFCQLSVEF